MPAPTRRCRDCGRDLPPTREYWPWQHPAVTSAPKGRLCRECKNARDRKRRKRPEVRERNNARQRERRRRDPESRRRHERRYRRSPKGRATIRAYRSRPDVRTRRNARSRERRAAENAARLETLQDILNRQQQRDN